MLITAFFDGSCGPQNPGGHVGLGGIIRNGSEVLHEFSEHFDPKDLGPTSNNLAEHMAFQKVILWLFDNELDHEDITIFGDSDLVVKQMTLIYRIKHGIYVPVAEESLQILKRFQKKPIVRWIPREQNVEADALSKLRLRERGIST